MTLSWYDLLLGDILICKSEHTPTQLAIQFGQLFTATMGGSSSYIHAQIVASRICSKSYNRTVFMPQVAESHGKGLTMGGPEARATVYRLKSPEDFGNVQVHAATVACNLVKKAGDNTGTFARYNMGRSLGSTLRASFLGTKGDEVIKQVAGDTWEGGFFCSMFVTVCYQVASKMLERGMPFPIEADSQAMSPAALAGYFDRHRTVWQNAGEFEP